MMTGLQHKAGPTRQCNTVHSFKTPATGKNCLPRSAVHLPPSCVVCLRPRLSAMMRRALSQTPGSRNGSLTCKSQTSVLRCVCVCVEFAVFSLFALLSGPTSPFYSLSLLSRGRSHLRIVFSKLNCHSFQIFEIPSRGKTEDSGACAVSALTASSWFLAGDI